MDIKKSLFLVKVFDKFLTSLLFAGFVKKLYQKLKYKYKSKVILIAWLIFKI